MGECGWSCIRVRIEKEVNGFWGRRHPFETFLRFQLYHVLELPPQTCEAPVP